MMSQRSHSYMALNLAALFFSWHKDIQPITIHRLNEQYIFASSSTLCILDCSFETNLVSNVHNYKYLLLSYPYLIVNLILKNKTKQQMHKFFLFFVHYCSCILDLMAHHNPQTCPIINRLL